MAKDKSTGQNAEEQAASETQQSAAQVEVRMLVDHAVGKCNTVQSLSQEDASGLIAAGVADDNPAAVAYAKSIAKAAQASDEPLE